MDDVPTGVLPALSIEVHGTHSAASLVDVVVTTSRGIDLADVRPQPSHVRVNDSYLR